MNNSKCKAIRRAALGYKTAPREITKDKVGDYANLERRIYQNMKKKYIKGDK